MSAPVIEVVDLCFSYSDSEVLHNVSFRVEPGDLVAMVGPNGGGKTTLLLLLLGILQPRWGKVRIFSHPPALVRSRIGYVPQQLHFDPRFPLTTLDVVLSGRVDKHSLGPYRSRDRARSREALDRVGMADLAERSFARLSGGERQRVLVARALAGEPDLLLLDEPTANVDPQGSHLLHELFQELRREMTVLFVSHNVNVVSRHVNKIICVNRTAALHPIEEIISEAFTGAYGGELAVILHDLHCHITDVSRVLQSEHAGTRRWEER